MSLTRRRFLKQLAIVAAGSTVAGARLPASAAGARVVVVGGGFGGATAAKYIRMWAPDVQVALVERGREFISCPLSNRVLGGQVELVDLTRGYGALSSKYGIDVVYDEVVGIDPEKREISLASGDALPYDRLIVSPGVDLLYDEIPGLRDPATRERVLHAWKAGQQTVALRRQLESMPDGGVYALTIPKAPYRCPPGPYERACQVAWYFKTQRPKSKVLILDANDKVQSKEALFTKVWREWYAGIVEYRPNSTLVDVDAKTLTAKLEFEEVKADVLNVVPPQRAAKIAADTGLITANNKWVGVDFLTYESVAKKNIHVLGDAILAAPAMPKSGHMANQHAKVAAAAVIALLRGESPNPSPVMNNTCYSFVSDKQVIHVASVHRYDPDKKTMVVAQGASGVSAAPNELEGTYAESWGRNIWADMLA
ncbi:MAG TPA: NAD(P)/FAD-dependent oxidoreductase [Burkholderiales bacterium]|nr:NAD(P)/FAD-dependent oxidoreductase [Burkholderiales bacterium]